MLVYFCCFHASNDVWVRFIIILLFIYILPVPIALMDKCRLKVGPGMSGGRQTILARNWKTWLYGGMSKIPVKRFTALIGDGGLVEDSILRRNMGRLIFAEDGSAGCYLDEEG
jgi:hypothetical protein